MATNYKNIVITPNIGNTADPRIQFSGGNTTANTDINLYVYPASNGTLSFEGSAGQLFSITNDLTGSIFSVNDVSGIPSIEVYANGVVSLAPFGGSVLVGNSGIYTVPENAQTGTAYTLVLADAGKLITLSNASAITLTIPTNASVAFPLDTRIDIVQYGTGQVTVGGAGVTIRSSGSKLKLAGQYSGATLWKKDTNEWILIGDIVA